MSLNTVAAFPELLGAPETPPCRRRVFLMSEVPLYNLDVTRAPWCKSWYLTLNLNPQIRGLVRRQARAVRGGAGGAPRGAAHPPPPALSLCLALSLTHTHILSLSHTHTHIHTHKHSLPLSHTLSLSAGVAGGGIVPCRGVGLPRAPPLPDSSLPGPLLSVCVCVRERESERES